jgi:hypothetical protein
MEHPVRCCATCGDTQRLRLCVVESGGDSLRDWWCPACLDLARSAGATVTVCPAWIERAILRQLPLKPLETHETAYPRVRAGRRLTDVRAG